MVPVVPRKPGSLVTLALALALLLGFLLGSCGSSGPGRPSLPSRDVPYADTQDILQDTGPSADVPQDVLLDALADVPRDGDSDDDTTPDTHGSDIAQDGDASSDVPPAPEDVDAGPAPCESADDCPQPDRASCQTAVCDGVCRMAPVPPEHCGPVAAADPCGRAYVCVPTEGCVPDDAGSATWCDDGVACTIDICEPWGCAHGLDHDACDDGNVCTAGTCTGDGCMQLPTNDPCDDGDGCTGGDTCAGGYCEGRYDTCVCDREDPWESNDSAAHATPVPRDPLRIRTDTYGGAICGGEEDWFRVDLAAGDEVHIELEHSPDRGALTLTLVGPDGELISPTPAAAPLLLHDTSSEAGGPLYIRVAAGESPPLDNEYGLRITVTPRDACVDDAHEEDDLLAFSGALELNSPLAATACPNDPDWYALPVPADRLLVVDARSGTPGTPELAVYGPDGNFEGYGAPSATGSRFVADTTTAGPYRLRVQTAFGPPAYGLVARIYNEDECVADAFEPNDTQESSALLGWGAEPTATVCNGDSDWFEVELLTGDELQLTVSPLDETLSAAHLEVTLHAAPTDDGRESAPVARSRQDWDSQQLTYVAPDDGAYGVRIRGTSPVTGPYALRVAGSGVWSCEPDAFEDDDTPLGAVTLFDGDQVSATRCAGDDDWFSFVVERPGSRIDLSLTLGAAAASAPTDFGAATRELVIALFDPDQTAHSEAHSEEGVLHITATGARAGTWTLAVGGAEETSESAYTLDLAIAEPACAEDPFEPNDTLDDATSTVPPESLEAVLCPAEEDWYQVALGASESIRARLEWPDEELHPQLSLHPTDSASGVIAIPTEGGLALLTTAPNGGQYRLRVAGDAPVALSYSLTSALVPAGTCEDDDREHDDVPEAPYWLPAPEGAWQQTLVGTLCPADPDHLALPMAAGDSVRLRLRHTGAVLPGALISFDEAPLEELSGGPTTGPVTFTAPRDGRLLLALDGGGDQLLYALDLATADAATCLDDEREPDEGELATPILDGATDKGVACPGDADDHQLTLAAGDRLTVDVVATAPSSATLALTVFGPEGDPLKDLAPETPARFEGIAGAAGPHRVRVELVGTERTAYDLTVSSEGGVGCPDDSLEENDERLRAKTPPSWPWRGLRCEDDDDWLTLTVGADRVLTLTLHHTAADGNLDVELYDPFGVPLAATAGGSDRKLLSGLLLPLAGDYALRVFGTAGARNGYELDATLSPFACQRDSELEPNERQPDAVLLAPEGSISDGLCSGDVDWFALDVSAGDRIESALRFFEGAGNLNLYLHKPSGQVVALGSPHDGGETLSHTVEVDGRYALRVFGLLHAENLYQLDWTVVQAVATPCTDDDGEDDDVAGDARPLPDGADVSLEGVLCPGDPDHVSLSLSSEEELLVEFVPSDGVDGVNLSLLTDDGALLAVGTPHGGTLRLEHASGRDRAAVLRVEGVGANDGTAAWTMRVRRGPQGSCFDDDWEALAEAPTLPTVDGSPLVGVLCPADVDSFPIGATEGRQVDVLVTLPPGAPAVTVELRDAADTSLANVRAEAGQTLLSAVLAAPNPRLVLQPTSSEPSEYALTVEVADPLPPCAPDEFEENDTLETAATLPGLNESGTSWSLVHCNHDDDWYRVDMSFGELLVLDVRVPDGSAPLQCALTDDSGAVLQPCPEDGASRQVALSNRAGVALLHVWADERGAFPYVVDARLELSGCEDDPNEEDGGDDDQAHARPLDSGVIVGGARCAGDDDWWTVQAAVGDSVIVDLTAVGATGPLSLSLYDPQGRAVGESAVEAGLAQVALLVSDPGAYRLRITGAPTAECAYWLRALVAPHVCTDDAHEPNESQSTALLIAQDEGTETSLSGQLCAGDNDWYAVDLNAGDILDATLDFRDNIGDLNLFFYRPSGQAVAISASRDDGERLSHTADQAGRWALRVFGVGGDSNVYRLDIETERATLPCEDDVWEPNGGPGVAAAVPFIRGSAYRSAGLCPGDEDWYEITLGPLDLLEVEVVPAAGAEGYQVTLLDPDLSELAVATSTVGALRLEWVADFTTPVRSQYLRVTSEDPNARSAFALALGVVTPGPCADDGFEDNDDIQTAAALSGEQSAEGVLCPGDDDWFELLLFVGDRLSLELAPLDGGGPLQLELYPPGHAAGEAAGAGPDDVSTLEFLAEQDGYHRVHVSPFEGAPLDARRYALTPAVVPHVCPEDQFEDNDTRDKAVRLSHGVSVTPSLCGSDADWWSLWAESDAQLRFDISRPDAQGPVTLTLVGPDGAEVASQTTAADGGQLVHATNAPGLYALRVAAVTPSATAPPAYVLTVATTPSNCQNDPWEPERPTATPYLSSAEELAGTLCAGDEDRFLVPLSAGETLTVTASSATCATPTLTLTLDGTPLALSREEDGLAHLSAGVAHAGTYGVTVTSSDPTLACTYVLTASVDQESVCAPDEAEPNGSRTEASLLPLDTPSAGTLCINDEDWLATGLSTGDTLTVQVTHEIEEVQAGGAPLVGVVSGSPESIPSLALYDPAGRQASRVALTGPSGTLIHRAALDGVYSLRLLPGVGRSGPYELAATSAQYACDDDTLEPDDTRSAATMLVGDTVISGRRCLGDDDWYTILLAADIGLEATLETPPAAPNLQLALYGPDGEEVRRHDGDSAVQRLRVDPRFAEEFAVRVTGSAAADSDYTLRIAVEDPELPLCPPDEFEREDGNDSPARATVATPGAVYEAGLCTDDTDWYSLNLPADTQLLVELQGSEERDGLEAVAYDPGGETLLTVAGRVLEGQLITSRSGTYTVQVRNRYGLEGGYTLRLEAAPGACPVDGWEPNDTFGTAAPLADDGAANGWLCPGDEEWFRLGASAGDRLELLLTGAIDDPMTLAVHTPDGSLLWERTGEDGEATGEPIAEEIALPVSGTYRLNVRSQAGVGPWTLAAAAGPYVCALDPLEPNDTAGDATPIGDGESLDASLCHGDLDWYLVEASAGDHVTVSAEFSHAGGDLDIALYDGAGVPLAVGLSLTDDERVSAIVPAGGSCVVLVSGVGEARNTYLLDVSVRPGGPACSDDDAEPDDEPEQAPSLSEGVVTSRIACDDDEDWFRVEVPVTTELQLDVDTDGAKLELTLFDASGATLAHMEQAGTFSLYQEMLAGGTCYLRVRTSVARSAYEVTARFVPWECPRDADEPNDDRESAAPLPCGELFPGAICEGDEDWYGINLASGESLSVELAFDERAGPLGLQLHDGVAAVAVSTDSPSGLRLDHVTESTGTYYLRIFGLNEAVNRYEMYVEQEVGSSPQPAPCP